MNRFSLLLLSSLLLVSGPVWGQQSTAPPADAAPTPAQPAPAQPQPVDTRKLLPDLAPAPSGAATRIGGKISHLDVVQDKLVIEPFGGGKVNVMFDGRTTIYRGAAKVMPQELKENERVSVETVLDGSQIFARSIHILTQAPQGESNGQILSYRAHGDLLEVRDPVSAKAVSVQLGPSTVLLQQGRAATRKELRPGALVSIEFLPDSDGHALARQISILAQPGTSFVFAGRVTYLDLSTGLLVLTDPRDQKAYEIHFDPDILRVPANLQQGADVSVTADFDGSRYIARKVAINQRLQP